MYVGNIFYLKFITLEKLDHLIVNSVLTIEN